MLRNRNTIYNCKTMIVYMILQFLFLTGGLVSFGLIVLSPENLPLLLPLGVGAVGLILFRFLSWLKNNDYRLRCFFSVK